MSFYGQFVVAALSLNLDETPNPLCKLEPALGNIDYILSRDIDRFDIVISIPAHQQSVELMTKIYGAFWSVQNLYFHKKPWVNMNILWDNFYSQTVHESQLKETSLPVLRIPDLTLALSEIQAICCSGENKLFDDNNQYNHSEQIAILHEDLGGFLAEYLKKPVGPDPAINKYNYTMIGGSFDHVHSGHKIFLGTAALQTKSLLVGVTNQGMLTKKKHFECLEDCTVIIYFFKS
jgi:hypothetical protein